jgi:RNA polymerase sigma-70 factor, ECF subfamily
MAESLLQPRDEDLARDARAGSSAAFEELVGRMESGLYGFLLRRTGNVHDAEDLSQKTFLAAWRALDRYDPARSFRAWLFTIAYRLAVDHSRVRRDLVELDENLAAADAKQPMGASDLWETARRRLSGDQWTALWLMYAEGLKIREVARVMRRTTVGVKVLLHRARRTLARDLAGDYGYAVPGSKREVFS